MKSWYMLWRMRLSMHVVLKCKWIGRGHWGASSVIGYRVLVISRDSDNELGNNR
jgi:hypothetical protein